MSQNDFIKEEIFFGIIKINCFIHHFFKAVFVVPKRSQNDPIKSRGIIRINNRFLDLTAAFSAELAAVGVLFAAFGANDLFDRLCC